MAHTEATFHLLVVDDNPTNLELMTRIVEGNLPEVRSFAASSAEEGFRLIETERIDGAFVDVQMPHVNGFEMCRRLKSSPATAHIPVVLLTAHIATPQSRAEGLDAGAYDFISQPVSNIEMLARIRVMLRLQREREELTLQNQQLHRKVESNSAALRWLTGLLEAGGNSSSAPELMGGLTAVFGDQAQPSPDHFANQLLPQLPEGWQNGLLRLALLDDIPLDLARRLMPQANIEEVLVYLWRHNYHVAPVNGGYRFSDQLRDYLLKQATALLTEQEQNEVHLLAANWYQEREFLVEALEHLLQAGCFEEAELLLSQVGLLLPLLFARRAQPLRYLTDHAIIAKSGWFSLFYGSCKLLLAPAQVEDWLELARVRFVAAGDERGELLALVQLVRQYLFVDGHFSLGTEHLPRIELLLDRQADLDPDNRSMAEFSLALGRNLFCADSIGAEQNARSAVRMAQQCGNPLLELEARIACGYIAMVQGRGYVAFTELESAWRLTSDCGFVPLFLQLASCDLLLHSGNLSWYREQRRQLDEKFDRGFLNQGTLGAILALFEVEANLLEGRIRDAAEVLQIGSAEGLAAANPHLQSWQRQFCAITLAQEGHREQALKEIEAARALRKEAGGQLHSLSMALCSGQALLFADEYDLAEETLTEALDISCRCEEHLLRPGLHLALAYLHQRRGETTRALEQLGEFLSLVSSKGGHCFACINRDLFEILSLAVENDLFPEVARHLALKYLASDILDDGLIVPRLEINLLGSFRIKCGESDWIEGTGLGARARHLLAELIFAGGQQLPIETLCGRVWPDSSAERARQSFDSTMLRLRKFLDDNCRLGAGQIYFKVERGILSLRHVEIDALRYRTCVEQGRILQRRGDLWQANHNLLEADRLWQGRLVEGFDAQAFYDIQECYSELRFEQIELLAALHDKFDNGVNLETLLLEGVRNDPIRETLIRRLLVFYRQQKSPVKQKKLLSHYRDALSGEDFSTEEIDEIIRHLESEVLTETGEQ